MGQTWELTAVFYFKSWLRKFLFLTLFIFIERDLSVLDVVASSWVFTVLVHYWKWSLRFELKRWYSFFTFIKLFGWMCLCSVSFLSLNCVSARTLVYEQAFQDQFAQSLFRIILKSVVRLLLFWCFRLQQTDFHTTSYINLRQVFWNINKMWILHLSYCIVPISLFLVQLMFLTAVSWAFILVIKVSFFIHCESRLLWSMTIL
jgi:hypothetical protein